MRRSALLGWILPAVITAAIAVYAGGVMTGRWDLDPVGSAGTAAVPTPESSDPEIRKAQQLCPLINQPEIVDIVEPGATVKGVGTTYVQGGDSHQCTVSLTGAALRLTVSRDRLRVADYQGLLLDAQPRTVLGHPALWLLYAAGMAGVPLRSASLVVAWDRADSGGSVEVAIIRDDPDPGDEARAIQIAERRLADIPGWPG